MTVAFHALWMLCALGGVVCSAVAARRTQHLVALSIGFVLAVVIASPERLPDLSWVGVASAGAAAVVLFRPRFAVVAATCGGVLGGVLTAMLEVQGLHAVLAVGAVALCLGLTVWLSRVRVTFAPDVLRDEALLALCLLGLIVSVVPGVLDGWQAAANLTVEQSEVGPATPVPAWTLALVGTSVALGALYSLWSRR